MLKDKVQREEWRQKRSKVGRGQIMHGFIVLRTLLFNPEVKEGTLNSFNRTWK